MQCELLRPSLSSLSFGMRRRRLTRAIERLHYYLPNEFVLSPSANGVEALQFFIQKCSQLTRSSFAAEVTSINIEEFELYFN